MLEWLARWVGYLLLAMLALYGYTQHKLRPMEAFCQGLPPDASVQQVVEAAKMQQFQLFDSVAQDGSLMIYNQRSPFWRFACVVEFAEGRLKDRQLINAD